MKSIFIALFAFAFCVNVNGQSVQRSTYGVFSTISINDSLHLAAGQVLTGKSESSSIEHGYYPLNGSLLNISEWNDGQLIKFYPNPTTREVIFSGLPIGEGAIMLQIFTFDGKLVGDYWLTETIDFVDLTNLAAGIYQLVLIQNNQEVFNQKLVKVD